VINLSPEEKTKSLQIGDEDPNSAEVWLFDPTHKAENIGTIDDVDTTTFPPQSISLYIIP
jgi:hypothetical protein